VNKARGASEEEARDGVWKRVITLYEDDISDHELVPTAQSLMKANTYYVSSYPLLFLISPLIISIIQLIHKWALVAMDMSNGSPVLLDGAQ